MSESEFYSLECLDAFGGRFSFGRLKNRVVVVVNVASLCGFSPQYRELQALYEKYRSDGLVIVGFPCNQFGEQEPLEGRELVEYCRKRFGVTFPLMFKTQVNGYKEHPVYGFLKSQKKRHLGFKGIRWNFEKFIVDRKGTVVIRYDSAVTPFDFEPLIKRLLDDKERSD